jgi:CHAT domain-containing protein/lipopolysaccharide biosynthesis regulator YciM
MHIEALKQEIGASWPHNPDRGLALARQLRELTAEAAHDHDQTPAEIAALAQAALDPAGELDPGLHNPAVAAAVVADLDQQAYQIQWRDRQLASAYGRAIERVGRFCDQKRVMALGMMIQGDAIAQLGNRFHEAWDMLSQAADLFLQDGDLVGWARTCTGRLGICIETGHTEEAMENARLAGRVLDYFQEHNYAVRLMINRMSTAYLLGQYDRNIAYFEQILPVARQLGRDGEHLLPTLYNNVGLAYLYQGEFHTARSFFEQAETLFVRLDKPAARDVVRLNIAYIAIAHGNHKAALKILHQLLGGMEDQDTVYAVHIKMYMAECYLYLNRNQEAHDIAQEIMQSLGRISVEDDLPHNFAMTHCHLAAAQSRLGRYPEAEQNLSAAIDYFSALGSLPWKNYAGLLLGEIAARQGNYGQALEISAAPLAYFDQHKQLSHQARALLLRGQCYLELGREKEALDLSRRVIKLARTMNSPIFQYQAHLLLGRIYVQTGRRQRGRQHLRAAMTAIRRLQNQLTITLRADFMGDKTEAFHTYMPLALQDGALAAAFHVLEQGKAQPFLDFISNRQQHYWRLDDPESQELIADFNQLREKHHFLYQQVYERALLKEDAPRLPLPSGQAALKESEQRLKMVAEQLYLRGGGDEPRRAANPPDLALIQERLKPDTVLVAFYAHADGLWAFVLQRDSLVVQSLDTSSAQIEDLLEKLFFNIRSALQMGRTSTTFLGVAEKLGQKLFAALFQPIQAYLSGRKRVVIVPYGVLHYVPFNILAVPDGYFIQHHELVVLPAAGLLTREPPVRPAGALVLAHSRGGRLPHVHEEAQVVAGHYPADVFVEAQSRRTCLQRPPVQILHVAAHGRQRLDRPELSYVELADGQLFTDDLLQHDLSYELVVLSACETGRAVVKAGEELIGLGRGVLSAGAGALVASLWPVEDEMTTQLMAGFYRGLAAGKTKAAALRDTQRNLLQSYPQLHPAFWGAFQLVGNPRPLSIVG